MREYVAVTSDQIRQLNDRVDSVESQEKTNEDQDFSEQIETLQYN